MTHYLRYRRSNVAPISLQAERLRDDLERLINAILALPEAKRPPAMDRMMRDLQHALYEYDRETTV